MPGSGMLKDENACCRFLPGGDAPVLL